MRYTVRPLLMRGGSGHEHGKTPAASGADRRGGADPPSGEEEQDTHLTATARLEIRKEERKQLKHKEL